MDLRCQAAALLRDKQITVRWIRGHQTASAARDAQGLDDIHLKNEVDRLAKLATTLLCAISSTRGTALYNVPKGGSTETSGRCPTPTVSTCGDAHHVAAAM